MTKFTYLREFLDDRVKKTIEALPHSPESYNIAKAILKEQFGKDSEIVKAYVKEIINLPYTPNANSRKILEFYEKLSCNVQALETLKKFNQAKGMVSLTLKKLPTIRGDLVRNDLDWENGILTNFPMLSASGHAKILLTTSTQKKHLRSEKGRTTCFRPSSRNAHQVSVFIARGKITGHLNALYLLRPKNAINY